MRLSESGVTRRTQVLLQVILTLCVLLVAGLLGFSRQFYLQALDDAFFGLALASVVILHQRIRPSWLDLACSAAGAIALGIVDFHFLHYPARIMAWFSFLGLSSFAIMILRSIWTAERKKLLYAWIPAAAFVMSDYFASNMLDWTARAHPKTLDLYLLSFDGSLRVPLAFGAGQLYSRFAALHVAALIAYIGLAIPITAIYAGRLVRSRQGAFPAMLAFLLTGPIGVLFYNLFPACGPHTLFGPRFPFHPFPAADLPRMILEPVAIQGVRNAIPSLHLAWTLLAWWYSKGLSRVERLVAFAFLAFTAFATLGTGEHYFVDLVVAFPFALLLYALCAYQLPWKNSRRGAAILTGLGTTLAWLAALRYATKMFWLSPIVPWALSAATIAFACILQAKLDLATQAHQTADPAPAPLPWLQVDSAVARPE
jgi:PAP2 superfamily protein